MNALRPRRNNNVSVFDDVRDEMTQVFKRFFGTPTLAFPEEIAAWAPRVDVVENDKAFLVKADLPGVEAKDVEISYRDGYLVLKGTRKEEREEKGEHFHRSERYFGEFVRSVYLPTGIDAEHITAATTRGVITVTVPKKPDAQPKKITVKEQ
jgi:HSP20 family protein